MQLTGTKFTEATALVGNDLSTFPDFPAEIRAPAGTLAGVSGFQIHFSSHDIRTPADQPDVLVALNPAALRANIEDLRPGGMVIVNTDAFATKGNLERAGYSEDPLPALRERFRVVEMPLDHAEPRGDEGPRHRHARRRPLQELLRPRPHVLALQPARWSRPCAGSSRSSRARCSRRTCAC